MSVLFSWRHIEDFPAEGRASLQRRNQGNFLHCLLLSYIVFINDRAKHPVKDHVWGGALVGRVGRGYVCLEK